MQSSIPLLLIGICAAGGCLPLCHFVAKRVSEKTSFWMLMALVAPAIPLGYLTWHDFTPLTDPAAPPLGHLLMLTGGIMAFFGLFLGRMEQSIHRNNLQLISNCEKQLEADRQAGLHPIILAFDLKQMGDIFFNQLRQFDKAVEAYDQAYALMKDSTPCDHPFHAHFYWRYGQALRKVNRKEEAKKFDAIRLEMPPIFSVSPGTSGAEGKVVD